MRITAASGRGALVSRIAVPPSSRKRVERRAGVGKGGDAVMHHAPDVAEQHVVAARQRSKSFDQRHAAALDDDRHEELVPKTMPS